MIATFHTRDSGPHFFISYRLLTFLFTPSVWVFHFLFVYLIFFLVIAAFVMFISKCLLDR